MARIGELDTLRQEFVGRGLGISPVASRSIRQANIEDLRSLSAALATSRATRESAQEQRLTQVANYLREQQRGGLAKAGGAMGSGGRTRTPAIISILPKTGERAVNNILVTYPQIDASGHEKQTRMHFPDVQSALNWVRTQQMQPYAQYGGTLQERRILRSVPKIHWREGALLLFGRPPYTSPILGGRHRISAPKQQKEEESTRSGEEILADIKAGTTIDRNERARGIDAAYTTVGSWRHAPVDSPEREYYDAFQNTPSNDQARRILEWIKARIIS